MEISDEESFPAVRVYRMTSAKVKLSNAASNQNRKHAAFYQANYEYAENYGPILIFTRALVGGVTITLPPKDRYAVHNADVKVVNSAGKAIP